MKNILINLLRFCRNRYHFKKRRKNESLIFASILTLNERLRKINIHREPCYVIGNGPSLRKHDLSELRGCKIVMNGFYLHPELREVNPHFYIFADPDVNDLSNSDTCKWWKEIAASTKGLQTKFVLPIELKDTFVSNELLSDRELFYVVFDGPLTTDSARNVNFCNPIPYVQNTIAEGILLAIFMGYKNIILLGADHDWLSHWNIDSHFYTGQAKPALGDDLQRPYYWWINAVNTMFQQYLIINEVLKDSDVRVYNCSEAGVLDVFPMLALNDLLRSLNEQGSSLS